MQEGAAASSWPTAQSSDAGAEITAKEIYENLLDQKPPILEGNLGPDLPVFFLPGGTFGDANANNPALYDFNGKVLIGRQAPCGRDLLLRKESR